MLLHYLVKYLYSKNRHPQEVIEENSHVRLGHSKNSFKNICLVKCLLFNTVTKRRSRWPHKNPIIDCTPLL